MIFLLSYLSLFYLLPNVLSKCLHPIYCDGPILRAVQNAELFNDSKTFVDMPTKYPLEKVLEQWRSVNATDVAHVRKFVNENFEEAGLDVREVAPVCLVIIAVDIRVMFYIVSRWTGNPTSNCLTESKTTD
jgi:hypothetical protein